MKTILVEKKIKLKMITGFTKRAFLFVLLRVTQGFGGNHFGALINIRRHTSDELHINSEVILQLTE